MRRYNYLEEKEVFEAFNKVRDAFMAAKNGGEVDKLMDGLLTHDEKIKIGRRILIANYILSGFGIEEITRQLRVGRNTVMHVARRVEKYKDCFDLIDKRHKVVEKTYQKKKYTKSGGSKLVHKKISYSGFKRKDVGR